MQEAVEAEDGKYEAEQDASDKNSDLHEQIPPFEMANWAVDRASCTMIADLGSVSVWDMEMMGFGFHWRDV
jgi:hypothetical protein